MQGLEFQARSRTWHPRGVGKVRLRVRVFRTQAPRVGWAELVNWQPRSEGTSARSTRSLVIVAAVAQPMICREYRPITAAGNN